MILVFIILSIIILINFIILILALSNIKLEVKKLHISNENGKLEINLISQISICFLNKIKILKYTIDDTKLKENITSGKINIQKLRKDRKANKDILKKLKESKYNVEYFKLEGYFSTFNTVLSSNIYALIQSIPPIIIAPKLIGKYINEIKYLNILENRVNVNFNCIISIKIVNIINILQIIEKKGGKDKNGKSSDRRSYAYSNE